MVVAKVADKNSDDFADDEDDFLLIGERVDVLISEGRLLVEGDIGDWRRSEIKLP